MSMEVVVGPPFSGKDRKVAAVWQPGDVVLDTTPIWRTFASPEPGAVRSVEDAAIANSMKRKGLERAVEQGRDGYVICGVPWALARQRCGRASDPRSAARAVDRHRTTPRRSHR